MKNPKYRQLYCNLYAKEIGKLSQGIPGLVEGTSKVFFVENKDFPFNRWRDITYGRIVLDYRPENSDPYCT